MIPVAIVVFPIPFEPIIVVVLSPKFTSAILNPLKFSRCNDLNFTMFIDFPPIPLYNKAAFLVFVPCELQLIYGDIFYTSPATFATRNTMPMQAQPEIKVPKAFTAL